MPAAAGDTGTVRAARPCGGERDAERLGHPPGSWKWGEGRERRCPSRRAGRWAGGPCGAPLPGSPRAPGRSPPPCPAAAPARTPGDGTQLRPPDSCPRCPSQAAFRRLCLLLSSPRLESAPTPRNPGPEDAPRREPRPGLGRATYPGGQRCPVLQNQSQPPGSHVWMRVRKSVVDQDKLVLTTSLCEPEAFHLSQ